MEKNTEKQNVKRRSTFAVLFYINRTKVRKDGMCQLLCKVSIDAEWAIPARQRSAGLRHGCATAAQKRLHSPPGCRAAQPAFLVLYDHQSAFPHPLELAR